MQEHELISERDWTEFNNGQMFLVVYGIVRYSDFFQRKHFTKFCSIMAVPGSSLDLRLTGKSCSDYNEADNN